MYHQVDKVLLELELVLHTLVQPAKVLVLLDRLDEQIILFKVLWRKREKRTLLARRAHYARRPLGALGRWLTCSTSCGRSGRGLGILPANPRLSLYLLVVHS